MKIHAFRLRPGQDLKKSIQDHAKKNKFSAGFVITCVGSLSVVCVRMANEKETTVLSDKHEIVSLTGTLSETGCHLHIAVADRKGQTLGGHLMEGSLVFTTAELVLGQIQELEFSREIDPQTGFKELVVKTVST